MTTIQQAIDEAEASLNRDLTPLEQAEAKTIYQRMSADLLLREVTRLATDVEVTKRRLSEKRLPLEVYTLMGAIEQEMQDLIEEYLAAPQIEA